MSRPVSPGHNVPTDTIVTSDEASEPLRRHQFRNDLTSAAAQMQEAIEQVRATRTMLLQMVHAELASDVQHPPSDGHNPPG